jgi:hypothetical protein
MTMITVPPLVDHIMRMLDKVGASSVACLVTDNASNMKLARELVEKVLKYKHIIQIP